MATRSSADWKEARAGGEGEHHLPLLRRLLREEMLVSAWRESAEGLPPRKYYTITDKGRSYLMAMGTEWDNLLSAIEEIRGEHPTWNKH